MKKTKAKLSDFDRFMEFLKAHYKEGEKHALQNVREDANQAGMKNEYHAWMGEVEAYEIDNGKFDHPKLLIKTYSSSFGCYGFKGKSDYANFSYELKS
jgi:hypothetical protein